MRDASTLEEMRAALGRAQRRLSKKVRDHDELVEAVYQAALDAGLGVGKLPAPPKIDKRKRGDEVALIHLTDWQYGKRTESFNRDVCEERIRLVMERSINITDLHRSAIPVKECHLMLGGDMVEGIDISKRRIHDTRMALLEKKQC